MMRDRSQLLPQSGRSDDATEAGVSGYREAGTVGTITVQRWSREASDGLGDLLIGAPDNTRAVTETNAELAAQSGQAYRLIEVGVRARGLQLITRLPSSRHGWT